MSPYDVSDGVTRTANPVAAQVMTEAQLQAAVVDLARYLGLTVWHDVDSRRNLAGFPDLVLIGRKVLWLELKRQTGRVRPEQQAFLSRLVRAGQDARVIRPADWLDGTVERLLRSIR
jgi:hypothetical protein